MYCQIFHDATFVIQQDQCIYGTTYEYICTYIHTYIQTRLAFNTLMWGSLRLAPNTASYNNSCTNIDIFVTRIISMLVGVVKHRMTTCIQSTWLEIQLDRFGIFNASSTDHTVLVNIVVAMLRACEIVTHCCR